MSVKLDFFLPDCCTRAHSNSPFGSDQRSFTSFVSFLRSVDQRPIRLRYKPLMQRHMWGFFNLLSFPPWPYDAFLTVIKGISVCVIGSERWQIVGDCCVEFWVRMQTCLTLLYSFNAADSESHEQHIFNRTINNRMNTCSVSSFYTCLIISGWFKCKLSISLKRHYITNNKRHLQTLLLRRVQQQLVV